ncbi:1-aminocyclopropane-1-carboxylate deaminase [Cylindrospermopsis raciborskii C04]|uniref:1-aminocyclopropane-1-carboxylate deaminase n=1 Tax=Cylindrospermopsis raciborskii C07 TaxID=2014886 RepID=A0ABX4WQG8_9CYAN|nr:pyridoxal-phosphate dependent enzyme [Cylindrospermopsis raciborskii]PNJ91217.1 1-aminocyclopropane-1-carboxylate deaminase [Cylindrospermopsis raciborskii C04]PNJ95653.1 1-aminocyclopropane-1-carboxylate deaminase [Cylindrospermopsis raciborskii C03]PNJ99592.1 1-aminocyclopropane-1-carboxylate deaminase [Cylindrospermopsis raciborskii C07]
MSSIFLSPPIQKIHNPLADHLSIELYVLRLDLIHLQINGNKWFKLKYNLLEAKHNQCTSLLTFGGAYSNHIFATAAAGRIFGFETIGVIRGEPTLPLNPTLRFAQEQGMKLLYCDRQTYRQRHTQEVQEEFKKQLPRSSNETFIIPEGGGNLNGVRGCMEIMQDLQFFDIICLACGTATTLTGIALSPGDRTNLPTRIMGFPVLKDARFLEREIDRLISDYLNSKLPTLVNHPTSWQLIYDYHFGGYGKIDQQLIQFCHQFHQQHHIPLDYIYTGKMFYGFIDLLKQGFFPPGKILLIHTGGLQGNLGIEQKLTQKRDNET